MGSARRVAWLGREAFAVKLSRGSFSNQGIRNGENDCCGGRQGELKNISKGL